MKAAPLACAALLVFSTPAAAQDEDDYRVRIGLGGQVTPKFIGSDDTQVLPLFDFDLARGANPFPFEAPDDSFGFKLISKGGFAAGPAANIQSKRKNSDVGADVGKVSTTVEVGGFASIKRASRSGCAGFAQGIGGMRTGRRIIRRGYIHGTRRRYVFSIGPRVFSRKLAFQRAISAWMLCGSCSARQLAARLPAERWH